MDNFFFRELMKSMLLPEKILLFHQQNYSFFFKVPTFRDKAVVINSN